MSAFRGSKKPVFRTFLFKISKGPGISKGKNFYCLISFLSLPFSPAIERCIQPVFNPTNFKNLDSRLRGNNVSFSQYDPGSWGRGGLRGL
jgi:hypothetical protein